MSICEVAAEKTFCFRWVLEMCHGVNEFGASLKNVRPTTALLLHIAAVMNGADIDPNVIDTRNDCSKYRAYFNELYSTTPVRSTMVARACKFSTAQAYTITFPVLLNPNCI